MSAGYFDWDTVWRNEACNYEVIYIRLTKQNYNNCFFWKSDSVKTLMPAKKGSFLAEQFARSYIPPVDNFSRCNKASNYDERCVWFGVKIKNDGTFGYPGLSEFLTQRSISIFDQPNWSLVGWFKTKTSHDEFRSVFMAKDVYESLQ